MTYVDNMRADTGQNDTGGIGSLMADRVQWMQRINTRTIYLHLCENKMQLKFELNKRIATIELRKS